MARHFMCVCLTRLVLPLCLATCVIFRQNILSFIYLLLLLYLPLVKVPTIKTMAGGTGRYLLTVMILSIINSIAQLSFQIVLLAMYPYGHFLRNCEMLETILRHVGLMRLDGVSVVSGIRILGPEALMLPSSILVYVLSYKLVNEHRQSVWSSESGDPILKDAIKKKRQISFFVALGKYIALMALCVAGVMRPSVPGALYFLAFLGGMTWWACFKELRKPFAVVMRFIMVFVFAHIMTLFAIQMQWVQEQLPQDCNYCRYLGLTRLVLTNCTTDPRDYDYQNAEWATYLNPVVLLILYYILAIESRLLFKPRLIRAMSPTPTKYNATDATQSPNLQQDALGSVTITDDYDDSIQLGSLSNKAAVEPQSSLLDTILDGIMVMFQLINKSSYIGTTIIMMAWSITYHSWLTFVLLLWASVLWILPNQRRAVLRCSPFLVCYAIFLLLVQYIYSMDLTESELPEDVGVINMRQIGFVKPASLPCKPLLFKSMYTILFWITLRQHMKERFENRTSSTLEDMAAPLQITLGTATRGFSGQAETKSSPFITNTGEMLKSLLTKFWIWTVAIMLFVIGIGGTRMTMYRIIYMGLFLIFILTFQLSYQAWRKMMYTFWLTVIIFSMAILVLVYTYQFDNFPQYWEKYMGIPLKLQLDLGLERFETGELFIRLLTPTFFLIITVIQVHYFHKDFLELSNMKRKGSEPLHRVASTYKSDGSSALVPEPESEEESFTEDKKEGEVKGLSMRRLAQFTKEDAKILFMQLKGLLNEVAECTWSFLEFHMIKIVVLSIMLMCLYDVCALHLILVLVNVIALSFGRKVLHVASHVSAVTVSLFLLARMIYQIEFFDHEEYNVNCTKVLMNTTIMNFTSNDAYWFGFQKTDEKDLTLPELLKGYIGLILVATLMAVVDIRQMYKRHLAGQKLVRPSVMYPQVKRFQADQSVKACAKYLFSYFFFKFGFEVCMITTVALIGSRMDAYSVLYGFWLCLMFAMPRERLPKVWFFYQIFIVIIIPIQYAMAIGLPPGLCIDYPWYESDIMRRLQDWMYLPDPVESPDAYKLVCDFVLLMMVCRQSLVFRIEKRYEGQECNAGNNKDISKEAEEPGFINPVPDHISHIRSWVDVFKRGALSSLMWITLAIVFLAGTNRVNIFSLGYLIGSFIFLWHGEELYLRPVQRIMKHWHLLLGYNVAVIMMKTLLQIVGCIFIEAAKDNACWAVQLFGVGCIKKFSHRQEEEIIISELDCVMPRDNVGLAWDGICFGFLILTRRLFNSYYFLHMVDEAKAMAILASRGAELIEELSMNQISEQQDREHQILEKIKMKMERIKATQQKVQGPVLKEPESHFVDGGQPRRHPPRTNREAIRSGDYYMFDDFDDDQLEEDEHTSDEDDGDKKGVTLSMFLASAMKTDIKKAADMALRTRSGSAVEQALLQDEDDTEEGRRTSIPILPRRQSSSFFTAQTQITPPQGRPGTPSPDLMAPSPAESRASYQSAQVPHFGDDDAGPSTREDPDLSPHAEFQQLAKDPDPQSPETLWGKVWMYIKFAWAFVESTMVTITCFLNRFSRDYRYVVKVLAMEKKMLKEKPDFGQGIRSGSSMIWQPMPSSTDHKKVRHQWDDTKDEDTDRIDVAPESSSYSSSAGAINLDQLEETQELSAADQPPIVRLMLAIWFVILSHSDLVCYFMVFLHQIKSATVLSLPLPLMVFLWGTLTVPRPTKTFWVTLIAYTEVIVIIKCMFQFDILPWNRLLIPENAPFDPPRIIGIEQKSNYALYDLLLLLIIFFHRFMLKSLGLWKSTYSDPVAFDKMEETFVMSENQDKYWESQGSLHHTSSLKIHEPSTSRDHGLSRVSSLRSSHRLSGTSAILGRRSSAPLMEEMSSNTTRAGRKLSAITNLEGQGNVEDKSGAALQDSTKVVIVKSEPTKAVDNLPNVITLNVQRYLESTKDFFKNLLIPSPRVTVDIYAYMFLCDFFNFMVVIFGFAAFGAQRGDGGVAAYLEENKVPIPFLTMLILQFALIIIDRALYLRKYILGKIIFQFILVVGIHIWMFFILPLFSERQFNALLPPQMWYMVKCFYLLLSAYQIRSGYPTRILGNVLCKRYNIINYGTFKGFMLVPFLFELRALMDWIWTDTSMTLMDWLKMEDIFAHIFQLKCARRMEAEYPQPRGERKDPMVKYFMGGGFLLGIIAVIWFPLVLFALGNTVGQTNLPIDVTIEVRIGPYQPVYRMSAQNSSISHLNENQWNQITNKIFNVNPMAQNFFSDYSYEDVAVITLNGNSTKIWDISPPDLERFIRDVNSTNPLDVKLWWEISRESDNPKIPGVTKDSQDYRVGPADKAVRSALLDMLKGSTNTTVVIKDLFPKFVKVTNGGKSPVVKKLIPGNEPFRDLQFRLNRDNVTQWWELMEVTDDDVYVKVLENLPFHNSKQLVMYTFNEKAFPKTLNFISGGGIIGLYTTMVLVVSKLFRNFVAGLSFKIMYYEMPNVDRVLQLCLDIYLVRESGELDLEEDLFAKLVFLYRSPETLIKWTRPREEGEDEGDGAPPMIEAQ